MTKEAISHYTLQLLLTQRKAFLPTLGMFHLEPKAAKLYKREGRIEPPSYEIHFAPSDRINEEHLKEQLLRWAQMTQVGAENISRKLTQELRDALIDGEVEIADIGILRNTRDGIVFEKDKSIDQILSPLPTLALPFAEATKEQKVEAAHTAQIAQAKTSAEVVAAQKVSEAHKAIKTEKKEDVQEEKKKSVLGYILIAAFLLLAVGSYAFFFLKKDSNGSSSSQVVTQVESPGDPETITEQEIATDVSESQAEETGKVMIDDELEESAEEVVIEAFDESQSTGEETEPADVNTVEPETRREMEITEIAEVSEKSGDCIVIVGAFGSVENADRMEAKLKKLGWKPYREQPARLIKMGAYVPCQDADLAAALRELQATVESGAWVLK